MRTKPGLVGFYKRCLLAEDTSAPWENRFELPVDASDSTSQMLQVAAVAQTSAGRPHDFCRSWIIDSGNAGLYLV